MRDVVDIALVEVYIPNQPRVECQEVMSLEVEDSDPDAETVKTMRRRRRPIGHKGGVPDFQVTLEVVPVNPPEVDYRALKASRTIFRIVYEENDGGQRFVLDGCRVTGVSKTRNQSGEATNSISILALDHRQEL